jgi:hypothetical protein
MVDLYPVAGATTARKETARMARKAYDKREARKTRADKVAAMRVKAATDAEANAGRGKCVSRPGSYREAVGTLAATREALAHI